MKRAAPLFALLSLSAALGSAWPQAGAAALAGSGEAGLFLDGRWEGSIDLGSGSEPLALRLFPADTEAGTAAGGLVDLPARKLFGYPMGGLERSSEGLKFSLLGGAPFAGAFELRGSPAPVALGESFSVAGAARRLSAPAADAEDGIEAGAADAAPASEGAFSLAFLGLDSRGSALGADCRLPTGRGSLPGSLLLPDGVRPVPVVLLLSGSASDRDGDNYSVPGRSDALADLALALRDRGIASLRYDRRGTGEAYRLASGEGEVSLDDHVEDARAAIAFLGADPRFSGLTLVGYGEGASVAAGAVAGEGLRGEGRGAGRAAKVSGLAALCASGKSELEALEEALATAPEELKSEARDIVRALRAGSGYPDPSPYLADYFRPGARAYLSSLFRFDLRAAFAAADCRALVVAGGRDLQVAPPETELLASARADASYRAIPAMSHALKAVGEDEESNYASFTDPSIPLAPGLADLVAAFARGEALPGEDPRAGGEVPPAAEGSASPDQSGPDAPGAEAPVPQGGEDAGEGDAG